MASERSPLLLHEDAVNGGRAASASSSYRALNGERDATEASLSYATSVSVVDTDAELAHYLGYDKHTLLATPGAGLSSAEAARRLKTFGPNELPTATAAAASLRDVIVPLVARPRAVLVWIAFVLEAVCGDWTNVGALLVFQAATTLVAWAERTRSTRARAALHAAVKAEAVVVRDGVHQTINASLLVPGDRVTLTAGVVVPADCELGPSTTLLIDVSLLTGESLPVTLAGADSVKKGSTVLAGEGDAIVVATGAQTFGADTAAVLHAHDHATTPHVEKAVLRLTAALVAVVAVVLVVSVGVQLFERERALRVVSYTAVFAAVAVPLSMPAVSKLIVVLGAQKLLDEKIISTRLAAIEKLASVDVLCCDKTGTLTRNKLELQDELPVFDPRGTREDVLVSAALAAKWKEPPRDAVDTLVLNAIDLRPLDQYSLLQHTPFDPTSKRTESVIRGPTGRVFKVTKGAPSSLLALAHNVEDVRDAVEAKVMDLARRGVSSLAVARTDDAADGKWVFLGVITYVDPPRHDSKRMIDWAHECGLSIKLTTGDQAAIAVEACRQLGMGLSVLGADVLESESSESRAALTQVAESAHASDIARLVEAADGYAHVLPHHKVQILQHLRSRGWSCGATGAGVADVAAMKAADLAIATDGASDAARIVADVLLAKPGLSIIVTGVLRAREILQRVHSFVTFQTLLCVHWIVWVTISMLLVRADTCHFPHFVPLDERCGVFSSNSTSTDSDRAIAHVEHVEPFFRVPIVALVALGFIQELAAIALLHDKMAESKVPQQWKLSHLVGDSLCIGATAAASSVLLAIWGLDGWNEHGVLAAYGVGSLSIRQVSSFVFLQVALSGTLSVLLVRTDTHPFSRPPSPALVVVVILNAAAGTLLVFFSPFKDLAPISLKQVLFVWVYSLLWHFLQGAVKAFVATVLNDMTRLGAVSGDNAAMRFDRAEAHRKNRIRLGLAFSSDDSTVRDSFVLGRAVRSSAPGLHDNDVDHSQRRLRDLEAEVRELQAATPTASHRSTEP